MEELQLNEGRGLVVVAHPDDETIWMGGTILKFPNVRWTIFSLCRSSDADRAPKFKRVCEHYGVRSIISDLEDEGVMTIEESVPAIEKYILAKLPERQFDYVFTHGSNGEYGHPRHIGVHRAMKELAQEQQLSFLKLLFFAYEADAKKKMHNHKASNFVVLLGDEELSKKSKMITELYGFQGDSFEAVSCLPSETFILGTK